MMGCRWNLFVRIIALILAACCLCAVFAGCDTGEKIDAGYQAVDAENERAILVYVSNDDRRPVNVVIRKLEKNKETKEYEAVQEYTPYNTDGGNIFCQTVQEEGLYEIEASCEGLETNKYTVMVNENRLYTIGIYMKAKAE